MADYLFATTQFTTTENKLSLFKEYAWDFEQDRFIYDSNGKHILLEGNDALKVWCYKVLRTERFTYLAYSKRFGIELYPFMAKIMDVMHRKSELNRMITEALMVNPYILSVDSIVLEEENRKEDMTIHITLTTIYGELVI